MNKSTNAPTDRPTRTAAAAVIGGLYLVVFGGSIASDVYELFAGDKTPPTPDDYSAPNLLLRLPTWWGEVILAIVVVQLLRHRYRIPAAEAGFPPKNSSPLPSLFTIVAGVSALGCAGAVMNALSTASTPDQNAGIVNNAWVWPGLISRSLNAGITEELIVVAIPVLLLSRRGWHPAAIVAVSALMRCPYHLWHGWPSSLPWALIWGAGFTLAYMQWRRLTSLIALHAAVDIGIGGRQLYGATGTMVCVGVYLATAAVLGGRAVAQLRANRQPGKRFGDLPKDARRFFIAHRRTELVAMPALVLAAVGVLSVVMFESTKAAYGPGTAGLMSVIVGLFALGIVATLLVTDLGTTNFDVHRDCEGSIDRVVQWRKTDTGELGVVGTAGDRAVERLIGRLKENGLPLVFTASPKSQLVQDLSALGYPPVRLGRLGRTRSRIQVDATHHAS